MNSPTFPPSAAPVLSHFSRFAETLALHIRENAQLRTEFLRFVRGIEEAVTGTASASQYNGQKPEPENLPEDSEITSDFVLTAETSEMLETELPPSAQVTVPVQVDQQTIDELTRQISSLRGITEPTLFQPRTAGNDRRSQLEAIKSCCRLKAKACRWASERRRLINDGADFRAEIAPRDKALIAEAAERTDCFLWMCNPAAPVPKRIAAYEDLAECFENGVEVAELLSQIAFGEVADDLLEQALLLAAEAQSAIRVAVSDVGSNQEDSTQTALFLWLKEMASEQQLYIPRFMRRTDVAVPGEFAALASRIENCALQVEALQHDARREKKALSAIRHHCRQLADGRDNLHDWNRIFFHISEIVPDLLRPSDLRLRQLLADKLDLIPESLEVTGVAQSVLESIDAFLSAQPTSDVAVEVGSAVSESVSQVQKWLNGRDLVVIGGDSRPFAKEALKLALTPANVIWITSRAHESPEGFRPAICGENVAVVLLAIRWSSHCFGVVKQYCEDAGKAFVRLPAGYNPNQVAHQIFAQVPEAAREYSSSALL